MRASSSDLPIGFENVSYSAGGTRILNGLSFVIVKGGPAVILGPNGSGKTTALKLAMGLIQPASGRITWGARERTDFSRRAFVFQRPVMLRRTAGANVAFALRAAGRPPTGTRIRQLLDEVGLGSLASRPARKLSAGEQQRLALAKAMAREPEILFLDEPTANLDPSATKAVEEFIRISYLRG
ncbi:MAG TPA: ABC transporter ATP-binding protein, partial [Hyphomicrobiales bacterium]|nr:ABC transporter ATP-binding protein [Hyphomicrobiales bacterium]